MKPIHFHAIFFICFLFCSSRFFAQDRKIDKLNRLFNNEKYRSALRLSDRLLQIPDYDDSLAPMFYKSLSLFYLNDHFFLFKRDLNPIVEADFLFQQLKKSPSSGVFFKEHIEELSILKLHLNNLIQEYKQDKEFKKANDLSLKLKTIFEGITTRELLLASKSKKGKGYIERKRKSVLDIASTCIGVPYLWGGSSLDGFDCSGFTSYVFQKNDILLSRTADDQFKMCKQIDVLNVKPGDLVFFNSGGEKITHVGIIVSFPNEPLKMIHASSSKGVMVSEIQESNYWNKKLSGFGSIFK